MKLLSTQSYFALLSVFIFSSCISDQVEITNKHYSTEEYQTLQSVLDLPAERDKYTVDLAKHMQRSGAFAPFIDDAKATLGRVLFYDTKLSATGETSCASCHDQALAFSDDKALSEGINGQVTERNSLPLASVANFSSSYDGHGGGGFPIQGGNIGFFWDERASSIADQSAQSIENSIEMGMDLNELVANLNQEDYYKILFKKAFGDELVTKQRMLGAIQEFVNSFVSIDSKFDQGLNQVEDVSLSFPNFTAQENLGREIFNNNCTSCHARDMSTPTGVNMANNGLDLEYADKGLGDRTGEAIHNGVFKVPFLRNIELTAPYMHDGRFATLEEVVEHYSSGIKAHDNLAHQLKKADGSAHLFNFNEEEKAALVAFMKTLTDHTFVEQTRFSDPFRQ